MYQRPIKPETLKVLEKKTGVTLHDIGVDKNLIEHQQHRTNTNIKCNYMKIKSFCTEREMASRAKRAHRRGDKGLISRIHKLQKS